MNYINGKKIYYLSYLKRIVAIEELYGTVILKEETVRVSSLSGTLILTLVIVLVLNLARR